MIDGEQSILPIVTFDPTTDWLAVHRIAQPHLERAGLERLIAALSSNPKSVAIEREYIDKDYRDTFQTFIQGASAPQALAVYDYTSSKAR